MKNLLIFALLLICKFSVSQNIDYSSTLDTLIFNSEWRESLNEPLNFITFRKQSQPDKIQFRIYRGSQLSYDVKVLDVSGLVLFNSQLKQEDQIDISGLIPGFYIITVSDGRNILTKILAL